MTENLRKLRRRLLGFTVVVLAFPGVALAHNTDPSPDDAICSTGDFCLYNAYSYSSYNGLATWDGSDQTYTGTYPNNASYALDNTGSSAKNRGTSCAVYIYMGPSWYPYPVVLYLAQGVNDPDLGSELYPTNNNASSHHWCSDNHT